MLLFQLILNQGHFWTFGCGPVVRERFADFEINLGGRFFSTPNVNLGIQNFKTNLNLLHSFDVGLSGPVAGVKFGFNQEQLFGADDKWRIDVFGDYSDLNGDTTKM